jgi:hypothetical protein
VSLVREALQKAEREAAARAAREKGAPPGTLQAAGQPYRAARRGLSRPLLAALVALPLLALAAHLVLRRSSAPAPASAAERAPAAGTVTSPVATAAATVAEDPAPPALPPAEPASAQPAPAPASVAAVASPPPAPPAAPLRAEPEVFAREAVLDAGATRIALGGIAWSEAAPLAYLNGKLRGVGESVAGLEIRAIERDRVVLAARDRTVVVTLR